MDVQQRSANRLLELKEKGRTVTVRPFSYARMACRFWNIVEISTKARTINPYSADNAGQTH